MLQTYIETACFNIPQLLGMKSFRFLALPPSHAFFSAYFPWQDRADAHGNQRASADPSGSPCKTSVYPL